MKGWLFTKALVPPQLIEKEDPKAGPGQVVVDIKACGLCHSDVGFMVNQDMVDHVMIPEPHIFGHECAGVIAEVGEGVTSVKVGDRVGVIPQNPENPVDILGCRCDGGYATKVLVSENRVVPMPDEVSFIQGAVGTDAGATTYRAMFTIGQAKKGMKVGIIGVGGLGQFGVQMALITGCEVYAADPNEEARKLAEELGCKKVYADAKELAQDRPALIIDFAGYDSTVSAAVSSLAKGGTVVVVGLGQSGGKFGVDCATLVREELSVKGSLGNTGEDIKGVYDYFATGKLTPQLRVIGFEEIGEGLELLKQGGVKGRLVASLE